MARGYPPEFRRRVLDLVASGRKVADVARDFDVSGQTIYNWRRQDRIDKGETPGLRSAELAELQVARRRIHELETELAATKRANELLRKVVPPKDRFAAIAVMAEEGHPAQMSCRVLQVTDSGYYAWRSRPPSARSIRHAWLTDLITQVHVESRGTYGALRVHAELTLGRAVTVGHNAVAMLMQRAGLQGLPGARKRRSRHETPTAGDLVERAFARAEPNQLWVTDITEHPTAKARCTAPWSSTCSPAASSDGPSTPRPPHRSSRAPVGDEAPVARLIGAAEGRGFRYLLDPSLAFPPAAHSLPPCPPGTK
jgi:putative transposase